LIGTLLARGSVIPADRLEITATGAEDGIVLHLGGRLNIDSSPLLRDRLLAMLLEESVGAVIIDLANVSYIDSSGVATLIEALKFARKRQVALRLTGLQGRLLHLFETTGVLGLFEVNGAGSSSPGSKVY